ncbi:hypothetical protein C7377_1376 [Balneicella halophila]|uniref:Uncharacterized protein n=1 Tax=Balneicella halophila TaxID=1537566 RepID=A0A7L4UPH3_BALHA|nr:hypothetical protein [Balneicella halophila]PVX51043.1 hypothetical protein C7377_1376 [Balneicella halophila]
MKRKTVFAIIAATFIFFGFGMLHGGPPLVGNIGSVMIGLGCIYLIYLIFESMKNAD